MDELEKKIESLYRKHMAAHGRNLTDAQIKMLSVITLQGMRLASIKLPEEELPLYMTGFSMGVETMFLNMEWMMALEKEDICKMN